MNTILRRACMASLLGLTAAQAVVGAAEWPTWGRDGSRNMVSDEKNVLDQWDPGQFKGNTEDVDMATTKNVKWVAKLGSQTYGNPTVAGGRVYVGTNNEVPRDSRIQGDRGVIMCLDEKNGSLLWQLAIPKLGTGKISDWEFLGICSSVAVEGDRAWIISNRGEVLCLDVQGQANGNDGPYKDEGQYMAGPGKPALEVKPADGDIVWRFDMREELGVFPHNISSGSVLIAGDRIVVPTSNGVDWTHTTIPNPRAPALCMLDKKTGELLGEEAVGISSRTMHSNWSSASYGKAGGKDLIVFGAGDGWCYAFDTQTVKAPDGINLLKEAWRFDCNPATYRVKGGKQLKYATHDGPSEVISTPVFHEGKVYAPIGQDPEHGEGLGNLVCIDASKGGGDITKTAQVWSYPKILRSLSTPAIHNGLVFAPDYSGFIHCLDAATGKANWVYDTKSHIWASPLIADGKVYVGTEDGDIVILAADKVMKEVRKIDMRSPVYSSVVLSNGTLYVATPTHLYAIARPG